MDLRTYLFENRIKGTHLAKIIGVDKMRIYAYCRGEFPRKSIAKKIVAFTEGKVTLKDLFKGKPKPKHCEHCGRAFRGRDPRKQMEMF